MLKASYTSQSDIPAEYTDLYKEKDGVFVIQVDGMKTQADVDSVLRAKQHEVQRRQEAEGRLRSYEALGDDPDEIQKKLDSIPVLEAKASGNSDDKMEEIVKARVAQEVGAVQRDLDKANSRNAELEKENTSFKQERLTRTITDQVRTAATEAKVLDTAIDDVLLYGEKLFEVTEDGRVVTRDGVGVPPGITAKDWLEDMQAKKGHWWPASQGGGAGGNDNAGPGGKNPFSKDNWNVTEQMKLMRENPERATRLREAASSA